MTKVTDEDWCTSSFSGQEANCVEVFRTLNAVRDSKHPDGPGLVVPRTFFAAAKAGKLDR
jgi:uncharacterized protein DUF397